MIHSSLTSRLYLHTWPVLPCDQTGKQDSVEQAYCTLGAVKRYWDTPCVGGRHNFFWQDKDCLHITDNIFV